jgi:hypothetical protein
MKLLVVTSCSNEKSGDDERTQQGVRILNCEDFARGPAHVEKRTAELALPKMPAESLYVGKQHVPLMRGIRPNHPTVTDPG